MLIECPRCTARYEVADGLIGPSGKSVRCARCGMVWLAGRSPVAAAEPPLQWPEPPRRPEAAEAPAPVPPPVPSPPAPAAPREEPALAELRAAQAAKGVPDDGGVDIAARPRSLAAAAVIGWVATVAVLGAAGWGAYTYRDAVMQAWPPSERVYLALGLRS